MDKAEQAQSRKEAKKIINKATKIREMMGRSFSLILLGVLLVSCSTKYGSRLEAKYASWRWEKEVENGRRCEEEEITRQFACFEFEAGEKIYAERDFIYFKY